MGKLILDIIDENDRNKLTAAGNQLCVLPGLNRLSYIISTADHRVLALREYEQEPVTGAVNSPESGTPSVAFFEKICAEDAYLGKSLAHVRVAWSHSFSTIVPARLYDKTHKPDYLQYLTNLEKHWEYGEDELAAFEAWNVYAIRQEELAWCRRQFPQSRILHLTTAFLNLARTQLSGQNGEKHFFIHTNRGEVRLVVLDKSRLYFSNAYAYQTAKDFLYYVLAVADEFDLDQEATPVLLSGQLMEDSEIYRLVYRYFRKLSFVTYPPKLVPGTQLKALPQHFYTDLYSLALYAQ